MSAFLLIHGAWHGAWCWDRVVPLLRAAGHDVMTPDLPALGADRTPWWRATLRGFARRVSNPILPLIQRVDGPDEPGVPQAYIECTRDQAISIELQRRMHQRFAMQRVVTMGADHPPFLSAPEELASNLDSIAETFTASAS